MQLVVIDVVGTEAAEAGLERSPNALGRGVALAFGKVRRVSPFGGDQHRVTPAGERSAQEGLRLTAAVRLGGVEVVDA